MARIESGSEQTLTPAGEGYPVIISATAPTKVRFPALIVGQLWLDTTVPQLKRCTNADTPTYTSAEYTHPNHSGDVTSVADGAQTIADAAVTLAKMANLAQDLFIGRTTASTGVPETATITAAARTVLDDTTVGAMVATLGGAATTGTGGLVRATSPTFTTGIGIGSTDANAQIALASGEGAGTKGILFRSTASSVNSRAWGLTSDGNNWGDFALWSSNAQDDVLDTLRAYWTNGGAFYQAGAVFLTGLSAAGAGTTLVISAGNEVIPLSSARRFKTNWAEGLDFDSARILDLVPRSFDWGPRSSTPGVRDFGLAAEDVYETLPALVTLDAQGEPYSVKYDRLALPLLSELAKLRERVAVLEVACALASRRAGLA